MGWKGWGTVGSVAGGAAAAGLGPIGIVGGAAAGGAIAGANGPNGYNPHAVDLGSYGPSPGSAGLHGMLSSMPQFQSIAAEGDYKPTDTPYQQKDYSGPLQGYDAIRGRLNQQSNQAQQQGQESIDRQFAAMGGGPGGARIKQTENLAADSAKQRDAGMQGIDFQEAQQRMGLQQQEEQRAFQSGEAGKQRQFQGQEGVLGRNLQRSQFNTQGQFQQNAFNFSANSQIAALDQGWQEAQAQANNLNFNAQLAMYQQQHSGGLLGAGGFLGSGIGV